MLNLSENAKSFISGWVTGCTQVVVMQPFEIIKVRQINQPLGSLKYQGFSNSFKTILREEGFLTFYKGKHLFIKVFIDLIRNLFSTHRIWNTKFTAIRLQPIFPQDFSFNKRTGNKQYPILSWYSNRYS